jgi:hypothetical protein
VGREGLGSTWIAQRKAKKRRNHGKDGRYGKGNPQAKIETAFGSGWILKSEILARRDDDKAPRRVGNTDRH